MEPKKSNAGIWWTVIIVIVIIIIVALVWHSSSQPAVTPATTAPVTTTSEGTPGSTASGGGLTVDLHRTYSSAMAMTLIQVDSPADDVILASSSLSVTGEASSTWFKNDAFPISLVDDNGKVLATGVGMAQGSADISKPVPFTGTITYTMQPAGLIGYLVLTDGNASSSAAMNQWVKIPVVFN